MISCLYSVWGEGWLRDRDRSLQTSKKNKSRAVQLPSFTLLTFIHTLSIRIIYLDPIRDLNKNTEFRLLGRFRDRTDMNCITHLLFFVSGRSTTEDPLLVPIAKHPVDIMTVAQAIQAYPEDAAISNLASTYKPHRKLHCIELAHERKTIPIVLLRPLNIFSKPQLHRKSGQVEFCVAEDVGKTVAINDGQDEQLLVPSGFRKQKKSK